MLSEYNPFESRPSSVEDDFRSTLDLNCNETDQRKFLNFSPSDAKDAWMASTEGKPSSAIHVRRETENRLSVDELSHPKERELRALMTASLDGDGVAYHTLLEQLTGHLRAYYRHRFARIGHGPTEAEDLLQEVLIAVHTHRHTYNRLQPFTPWIHAIARYKFLDYLRRTKSSFKDIPIASVDELTAANDAAAVESGLDLQRLMSKLSSKAREVIRYVKLEGLSVREAAKRCGMSESAVKVAVHRGFKALALQIRKESEA